MATNMHGAVEKLIRRILPLLLFLALACWVDLAFAWEPPDPRGQGEAHPASALADASPSIEDGAAEGKSVQRSSGTLVVCIDPGHGGNEVGASSHGLKEKDLNLKISLALRDELNTYQGVRVIMTRSGDSTVGLDERPAYAALNGADLFISIHCNAVGDTDGFEVWVPNFSSYYAAQRNRAHSLGYKILEELAEFGRTNRGVKTRDATWGAYYSDGKPQDYYAVIRGARVRGIAGLLVEHCYLDQDGDAAVLSDDNNLIRMGIDDATAIAREYGLTKRSAASTGPFKRCAGDNALGTMLKVSTTGFADNSCPTAVLATFDGYWDALSASALAGANKCPVLLTRSGELASQTRSELVRLGVKKAYIVGGLSAVSQAVENQVRGMNIETVRLAGAKAMDTALAIYREGAGLNVEPEDEATSQVSIPSTVAKLTLGSPDASSLEANTASSPDASSDAAGGLAESPSSPTGAASIGEEALDAQAANANAAPASVWGDTAIVATVSGYWDALAISPYAYAKRAPVFLAGTTAPDGAKMLDDATLEAIGGGDFKRVVICGGASAVSSQVEKQLATVYLSGSKVKRLAGSTSIETSSAVASFCLAEGMSANRMGMATASGYWDALTGSALCGKNNAPLVLVGKSSISTVSGFVTSHRSSIGSGYIFGGSSAVSASIEKVANKAARG